MARSLWRRLYEGWHRRQGASLTVEDIDRLFKERDIRGLVGQGLAAERYASLSRSRAAESGELWGPGGSIGRFARWLGLNASLERDSDRTVSLVIANENDFPDHETRVVAACRLESDARAIAEACEIWQRDHALPFPPDGDDEVALKRFMEQNCPHDSDWAWSSGRTAWTVLTIELR